MQLLSLLFPFLLVPLCQACSVPPPKFSCILTFYAVTENDTEIDVSVASTPNDDDISCISFSTISKTYQSTWSPIDVNGICDDYVFGYRGNETFSCCLNVQEFDRKTYAQLQSRNSSNIDFLFSHVLLECTHNSYDLPKRQDGVGLFVYVIVIVVAVLTLALLCAFCYLRRQSSRRRLAASSQDTSVGATVCSQNDCSTVEEGNNNSAGG